MKYYIYHTQKDKNSVPDNLKDAVEWLNWHNPKAILLTQNDSITTHLKAMNEYGDKTIIEE